MVAPAIRAVLQGMGADLEWELKLNNAEMVLVVSIFFGFLGRQVS